MGNFAVGSGLEIPGLEAILEYGDSSGVVNDRIPRAMLINDRSVLEQIRVKELSGLHDDPDGRDTREARSDRHGEDAGLMLYGGRTIGLTGEARAGSIHAMRDVWNRFRAEFGVGQQDVLVHPVAEVPLLVNELPSVDLTLDRFWWDSFSTTGSGTLSTAVADGSLNVGELATTGLSSTSTIRVFQHVPTVWDGRDVYLAGWVKVHSTSPTITNLKIGVAGDNSSGVLQIGSTVFLSPVASPTTGTWYFISGVITASSLLSAAPHGNLIAVIQATSSGSGNTTIRFDKTTMVFLKSGAATPVGWIGKDIPGFEYEDVGSGRTRSYGPCYAVNLINDPLCATGASWAVESSGSPTVAAGPTSTRAYVGDRTPASIYLDATQATSSTRLCMTNGPMVVVPGHTYKVGCKIKVLTNGSGTIDVLLRWIDRSGSTLSSSNHSISGTGEFSVSATSVAPADAVAAKFVLGYDVTPTTGSSQRLQVALADPFVIDVTYYDSAPFAGNGRAHDEIVGSPLSRRRIPRPFLIKTARKTSDSKAPEQQSGPNAWRDFTMSLRASDPRVYVLDERNTRIQMVGSPKFFDEQPPTDFTLETSGPPVPTGWTYEGHFLTDPGVTPYVWSRQGTFRSPLYGNLDPNQGVGFKAWDDTGNFAGDTPTQSIVARMYRSLEAYTYTKPRVVSGTAPSNADAGSASLNPFSFIIVSGAVYCTTTTILLKRVNSTTWLELRWNSVSHATHGVSGGPFAFELWCSHNTSGTLAMTKLASWDYSSYDSSHGAYPFKPGIDPQWLVSWLDVSNVVHWELWNEYPSSFNTSGRYESGSFTLPSGLISVVGAAVAGHAGRSLTIQQPASGSADFYTLAGFPPFWHYFESSAFDVPPVTATSPVIGDIDTPQTIKLQGDLVDPVIQISVPEYDGFPARTSVARMKGTIAESNPVTIDLTDGSIIDSMGNDLYSLVMPGFGDFAAFRPGQNYVSIQATNWASDAVHATVSWRDALR